jgi:hypothetical protein
MSNKVYKLMVKGLKGEYIPYNKLYVQLPAALRFSNAGSYVIEYELVETKRWIRVDGKPVPKTEVSDLLYE